MGAAAAVCAAETRDAIGPAEYLDSIGLPGGAAVADEDLLARVLARSLVGAGEGDVRAFRALGQFAADWTPARRVAEALGEPEPRTTRRLERLVRRHLVVREARTGLYRVTPELV